MRNPAESLDRWRQPVNPVLTDEFVEQVRPFVVNLLDEFDYGNLEPWGGHFEDGSAPKEWIDFFQGLNSRQKATITNILNSLRHAGYTSIGDIRRATIEELNSVKGIGKLKAEFVSRVFKLDEGFM